MNILFFVDRMVEELGLMPPDPSDSPAKQGVVTFLSFVAFGIVPLLAYIFGYANTDKSTLFGISIGLSALTLVLLGVVKVIIFFFFFLEFLVLCPRHK